MIIAIDGFSSCGKSTLAKSLAARLGYIYVDTGAMYRAVTLFALRNGFFKNQVLQGDELAAALPQMELTFRFNPETRSNDILLNGENVEHHIRGMEISSLVSEVSSLKKVREEMVRRQKKMGHTGDLVMDGRDIGTVVFPDADLKIFVTASEEIRTQRRFDELQQKGMPVSREEIRENIRQRDTMDQQRKESPLRRALDAIVLDNSNLSRSEQLDWALKEVEETRRRKNARPA